MPLGSALPIQSDAYFFQGTFFDFLRPFGDLLALQAVVCKVRHHSCIFLLSGNFVTFFHTARKAGRLLMFNFVLVVHWM